MKKIFILLTFIILASCKHSQESETRSKSIESESDDCKLCAMTSFEIAQAYHHLLAGIYSESNSPVERRLKFLVGAMPEDHAQRYIRSIALNYGGSTEDPKSTAQFIFNITSEAEKLGGPYAKDIDHLLKLDQKENHAIDFDRINVDHYLYGKKPSESEIHKLKSLIWAFPNNRADLRIALEGILPLSLKGRLDFMRNHIEDGQSIASYLPIEANHIIFCNDLLNELSKRDLLESLLDSLSQLPE